MASSRTIGGNAESFTQQVHAVEAHTGIPGVGSMVPTTGGPTGTTRHDTLDHATVSGNAQVMAALQFGGDWSGGSNQYLRINGDPNSATVGSSNHSTRAYMPFDGEIVGATWNSVNNVTRQAQVYLNGSLATGFSFPLGAAKRITPSPVAFSAGAYIEVFGNSALGSGDPSDVTTLVWIRSYLS